MVDIVERATVGALGVPPDGGIRRRPRSPSVGLLGVRFVAAHPMTSTDFAVLANLRRFPGRSEPLAAGIVPRTPGPDDRMSGNATGRFLEPGSISRLLAPDNGERPGHTAWAFIE
jgi:hypothetical protein